MTKAELLAKNLENHKDFVSYILSLEADDYAYDHHGEKWDAGQQLDHIYRSVRAVANAVTKPKFALKWKFGKANRPSKTFEELVAKYTRGLQSGFKAVGPFIPEPVNIEKRQDWCGKLMRDVSTIQKRISKYSETDLDTVILPHPAMGKMTMREIMYFTIHHVAHHLEIAKRNISMMSV